MLNAEMEEEAAQSAKLSGSATAATRPCIANQPLKHA